MLAGIGFILVGCVLMAGGASTDPNVYPEAEIYGFRRTILAPIVVLIGFVMQIFAIFAKSEGDIVYEPIPQPKLVVTPPKTGAGDEKTTTGGGASTLRKPPVGSSSANRPRK